MSKKKILGVEWNVSKDEFIFTFSDIIETAESLPVTKRNILKISAMFFDPLGLICPLVLQVKLLFKEAYILNVKWDDLLPTEFEVKYNNFIEELRKLPFTSVPRYLFGDQHNVTELELHGFCDASIQAYSAAVYVRSSKNDNIVTNLLTAKSKIVPNRKLTVPKLELMSCLLLSRLIVSVRKALSVQVKISDVVSWSDSKVSLYWVKSVTKKWKIWVENRVSEIRENVGVDCWRYVPTDCNSADVATRYNKKLKFEEMLWWKGPLFSCERKEVWPRSELTGDYGDALDLNQQLEEVLIAPIFSSVSVEGNICYVVVKGIAV